MSLQVLKSQSTRTKLSYTSFNMNTLFEIVLLKHTKRTEKLNWMY